jgi:uncharacterized protein YigE (DUF2233 family)
LGYLWFENTAKPCECDVEPLNEGIELFGQILAGIPYTYFEKLVAKQGTEGSIKGLKS